MTHRSFRDKAGLNWDVWEVRPSAAERRYLQRRIREEDRRQSSERRSGEERRRSQLSRTPVASEFARGWLCFECPSEKRRLAPVPEGWERAKDDTIEQWCCSARPVVRRKSGGAEKIG